MATTPTLLNLLKTSIPITITPPISSSSSTILPRLKHTNNRPLPVSASRTPPELPPRRYREVEADPAGMTPLEVPTAPTDPPVIDPGTTPDEFIAPQPWEIPGPSGPDFPRPAIPNDPPNGPDFPRPAIPDDPPSGPDFPRTPIPSPPRPEIPPEIIPPPNTPLPDIDPPAGPGPIIF